MKVKVFNCAYAVVVFAVWSGCAESDLEFGDFGKEIGTLGPGVQVGLRANELADETSHPLAGQQIEFRSAQVGDKSCWSASYDIDRDGYAGTFDSPDCALIKGDRGGWVCPAGCVPFREAPECDHAIWDLEQRKITRLMRSNMAWRFDVNGDGWHWGISDFQKIHRRQSERPFNGIDDDCDGWIDESEFVYWHTSDNAGSDYLDVRFNINDQWILDNVDSVEAYAVPLAEVDAGDIARMRNSTFPQHLWAASKMSKEGEALSDYMKLRIEGLDPETVYVVALRYLQKRWGQYSEVTCFGGGTSCSMSMYSGTYGKLDHFWNRSGLTASFPQAMGERLASDIYIAMTETNTIGTERQLALARATMVKKAVYEWNMADRGLSAMGNNMLEGELDRGTDFSTHTYQAAHMNRYSRVSKWGERYGATEAEAWCSEFYTWVFNRRGNLTLVDGNLCEDDNGNPLGDCGTKALMAPFIAAGGFAGTSFSGYFEWAEPGNLLGRSSADNVNPKKISWKHTGMLLAPNTKHPGSMWVLHGNTSTYEGRTDVEIELMKPSYKNWWGNHETFDYVGMLEEPVPVY